MATWKRRGRVPTPADRHFRAWSEAGGWLFLPRGLTQAVLDCIPRLRGRVRDRRLLRPAVDWHWQGHLFDYQRSVLDTVRRTGGGTLIAPPGAGKTEMGLAFAASMRQPALWLVNSLDLADQALTRARRLFLLDDSAYGMVDQHNRSVGTHLTIATMETLARYPDIARQVGARCGTVIVDECHHVPTDSLVRVLKFCPGRYRLGLTATDDRGDNLGPVIPALMGPRTEVPVSALVRAGRLLLPRVEIVFTRFGATPNAGWDRFQLARARDPARNALAAHLAVSAARLGRRVLVIVELVEHASTLAALIRRAGVPCSAMDGHESRERRGELIRALRARPGRVLVATKLADEGLDLPEADCLVLVTPGRSPLRLRQQVGRVMRVNTGKRSAVVYDMADMGSLSLKVQLHERLRTYRRFGDVDLNPRRFLGVA
jgi:superfamily II DNA or RNA helicase